MRWATSLSVPKRPNLRDTHANSVSLGMSVMILADGLTPTSSCIFDRFLNLGGRILSATGQTHSEVIRRRRAAENRRSR